MRRRDFITLSGTVLGTGLLASFRNSQAAVSRLLKADVAIIGAGLGGVAAALAALRNGLTVVLTEETDWIGGQLTQQSVPPDEHRWIEQFGATRSYRRLTDSIRSYYKDSYPLSASAANAEFLNPGNCSVSRICHEPRVALAVLEQMMAPFVSKKQLTLLLEHKPLAAQTNGVRVHSIVLQDLREGWNVEVEAPCFLDATETGELLPLSGVEYVTGAESKAATGEPHAADEPQPQNMQAITWCFAMEYRDGEDFTIDKPGNYDFWRDYVPDLTPPWTGKLLDWKNTHPITLEPRTHSFDPRPGASDPGLWRYRRLLDSENFDQPGWPGVSLVNWPQNDYWEGSIVDVREALVKKHMQESKELSLALFYWLQTEAPRPDGGLGWKGLRLRGDLTGTSHGLAKRPYIRESRRIKAVFTVLEQHIGTQARVLQTGRPEREATAAQFEDSVGVGSYRIDLHPSTGGDNYIDISSLPFQVPLGALIPERVENLLPAAKNIGTTHITNGCYRLHPVEWNIGEAAGCLAAFCKDRKVIPRQVRNQKGLLSDFQRFIRRQGIETEWPDPLRTPR